LFEIGFVSSFISAAIANHNMTRKQLDTMFDKNRAKSMLENRELANFLHGNVQNRLLAIALMLESKQVGLDEIVDELDRVEKLLQGEFNQTNKKNDSSLIGSLELLRDRWLGFVAIDFILIGDQKISSKQNATLVQLVNEAITNAVRHGLAKNIQIRVTQTKHGCEIIATDDGIGLKQGAKGIGSDYFDSVADLGWSLEAGEFGGSVLTLRCSP
jgi:two-component sensor histidine kinase